LSPIGLGSFHDLSLAEALPAMGPDFETALGGCFAGLDGILASVAPAE